MNIRSFRWAFVPICLLGFEGVAGAQLNAVNQQLISSTRINLTQYDYLYKVSASSSGAAWTGVTATVTSSSPNTIVTEGYLLFPDIPAGGTVASTNTFTLRQDRRYSLDPTTLTFTFASTNGPQANAGPDQLVARLATVRLDGSGSSNTSLLPLNWSWSFVSRPVGSTAVLSNASTMQPTFIADIAGYYMLKLVVADSSAASLPDTVLIGTNTLPPAANAGANQTISIPKSLQLDGSGSTDVSGHSLGYSWKLLAAPTGSAATLSSATAVKPFLNADLAGSYVMQLIVNDGSVVSAASVLTVSTSNTAPVANAGTDQKVGTGTTVQLNGSASTDVNGDSLSYRWSFVSVAAGSAASLVNADTAMPTFTADQPGTYEAQLRVSDASLASYDTVVISTCACLVPIANAGTQRTASVFSTVILDGTGSVDPSGLALTYQWTLVARPAGSSANFGATSTSATPQFTADIAGTYVAQLRTSNGSFSSNLSTVVISTSDSQPIANPGLPQNIFGAGSTIRLNGAGSIDPDGSPLQYRWAILSKPAGSAASLAGSNTAGPAFIADQLGLYIAQLIVNDGTSDSAPRTVLINVKSPTVDITLSSLPSGINFSVSGAGCNPGNYITGPTGTLLTWTRNASCTVAVSTPQSGSTGMQFVFANWNDGNTSNPRTFTTPAIATSFTVSMASQFLLTTVANPPVGGAISPATGFYSSGATVSATASAGYLFTGFAGALTGITTPRNVTLAAASSVTANFGTQAITGCSVFPSNNVWNTRIDKLPVDANSDSYIATIGLTKALHPDFSSNGDGIPFITEPGTQPGVVVNFDVPDESDPGPYPLPVNAPMEAGSDSHVLVVDGTNCVSYEIDSAALQPDGSWTGFSGAKFDLTSNQLRPIEWTSADAAGLPIVAGLVSYDEFATGEIRHAIRMTAPQTRNEFIWPARHRASSLTGAQYPPMGQRFRLKANFDITSFSADAQVVLRALKTYGMILADNGSSWFITGVPDSRWDDTAMHQLTQVFGGSLEAVDESSLMIDPDSGAAIQP